MTSTSIIADLKALVGKFTTTTYKQALDAGGPIQEVDGNINLAILKFQEAKVLLDSVEKVIDAGGNDGSAATTIDSVTDLLV
jgi:hypothetical protein